MGASYAVSTCLGERQWLLDAVAAVGDVPVLAVLPVVTAFAPVDNVDSRWMIGLHEPESVYVRLLKNRWTSTGQL